MSLLSRIIPNALCCFHPTYHNDDDTQPSPARTVAHTIPRKPMPYAMINVPHEPEMTDAYAFRRLFTQSPACPHEDTPISGTPNPDRLRPQGSLDLDYRFGSGSPMPTAKKSSSIQKLSQHVKQRISEPRLSKSSSRAEIPTAADSIVITALDPDAETTGLGISARSTGLSDFLRSRDGSIDRYDKDAESLKTPNLLSPAATIKLSSREVNKEELNLPLQLSITPSKVPHTGGLVEPNPWIEAESLKNLAGVDERATIVTSQTSTPGGKLDRSTSPLRTAKSSPQPPSRRKVESGQPVTMSVGSSMMDPETPQTIVRHPSARFDPEQNATVESKASDGRSTELLESLDPALVEYLARSTPSRPLSSMIKEKQCPQEIGNGIATMQEMDPQEHIAKHMPYGGQPFPLDSVRAKPVMHSQGYRSVHLFDMHISKRLASKSQATFVSPTASGNTSRKSFDVDAPSISASDANSFHAMVQSSAIRAEHNRRPSDPHTRQLFERPGAASQPYWLRNGPNARFKSISQERDDASSYYTYDAGPPSSAGDLSSMDGARSIKLISNSIAIGGRSASYDLQSRPSAGVRGWNFLPGIGPQRSLSTSCTQASDSTARRPGARDHYVDGSCETKSKNQTTELDVNVNTEAVSVAENAGQVLGHLDGGDPITSSRRNSVDWIATGQDNGWNFNLLGSSLPVERRYSVLSSIAPDGEPEIGKESTTDMWNRAYRTARADLTGQDLLLPDTLDIEQLRRASSSRTIRKDAKFSGPCGSASHTARRSRSAEPQSRKQLKQEFDRFSPGFSRNRKKLSFLHLGGARRDDAEGTVPRKLRKRSAPQLSKKSSFAASKHSVSSMLRPGHTPPLKQLLGIWGAFPEHDRARRQGPAGKADSVLMRDFAVDPNTPSIARSSSPETVIPRQLSAVHTALRALSFRASKRTQKGGRSLSFPSTPRHSKVILRKRLQRLYRTKSSEWRGYMLGHGHRTSVSCGQFAEYPELETLPGQGLFEFRPKNADTLKQYDGVVASGGPSGISADSENQPSDTCLTPNKVTTTQVNTFWKPKSNTSLAEPSRQYRVRL